MMLFPLEKQDVGHKTLVLRYEKLVSDTKYVNWAGLASPPAQASQYQHNASASGLSGCRVKTRI